MTVSKDYIYEDKEKEVKEVSVEKPEGMSIFFIFFKNLFKVSTGNVIFLTLKHCHKL